MVKKRKYEKEYKEYYENLLQQLKNGGINRLGVQLARTRYEHLNKAYNDFVDLYEENNKEEELDIQVTLEPEGK